MFSYVAGARKDAVAIRGYGFGNDEISCPEQSAQDPWREGQDPGVQIRPTRQVLEVLCHPRSTGNTALKTCGKKQNGPAQVLVLGSPTTITPVIHLSREAHAIVVAINGALALRFDGI